FATKHGFHRTRAEVRSAREEKRSRPRRGEYGLPRLSQRFSLSLAPEEMALVETVLADVAAAAGKRLGSASHEPIESVGDEGDDGGAEWMDALPVVDPKTAFLLLCRVFHETEGGVEGFLASRTPRKDGPYAVTFKQCPTCHASAVSTNEGEVSVPPEVVDRVVGSAEIERFDDHGATETEPTTTDETPKVVPPSERDRPNSPAFSRKVKRRDGNRCLNCGKRACLQAHHIIHRVHG